MSRPARRPTAGSVVNTNTVESTMGKIKTAARTTERVR
jgi:hypothetical protein